MYCSFIILCLTALLPSFLPIPAAAARENSNSPLLSIESDVKYCAFGGGAVVDTDQSGICNC